MAENGRLFANPRDESPSTVDDDEQLNRWIAPHYFKNDAVQSAAFRTSQLSVSRERITEWQELLSRMGEEGGIAQIGAKDVRAIEGLAVRPDPDPDDLGHAIVHRKDDDEKVFSKSQARKLRNGAKLIRAPR